MKKLWLAMVAGLFTITTIISCSGGSELVVSSRYDRPYYNRPMARPGYVWIEGDWIARGGRYYWREGHWARRNNRVWIQGDWQPRGNGYYWRRGHWRR